jgi:PAS domain S-box-containing protein
MTEEKKTKQQLIDEVGKLHQRIAELERPGAESKKTETALRESEEKYRTLIESTLDFVFTVDRKGLFTYVNPRFEMVTGRTSSELVGQPFTDILSPEAKKIAATKFKKGIRGEEVAPYEVDIIHKSGSRIPVEFNVATLRDANEEPVGRYGIGRDLTERRRTEAALRESEDRLHSIVQGSPISTFVINKEHRVVYWNKALEELSRIKAAEVIGTPGHCKAFYNDERPCLADLLVDEDFDSIHRLYAGRYEKSNLLKEAYESLDFFPDLGNGGRWLRFTAAAIRDTQGNLIGAVETLQDITDRKETEMALIESEEKYRLVVENVGEAICIARDGMLKFINREAVDIMGYSEEILTSRPFIEFIHPSDRQMTLEIYRKKMKGDKDPSIFYFRVVAKDGAAKWIEVHATPISWRGRPALLNFLLDITERKHADEKLQQSISLLTATLESTADGILVVDKDGKVTSVNNKFLSMWRIPGSLAVSAKDDKLLTFVLDQLKDPEDFIEKVKFLYSRPEVQSFDVLEFKDGRIFERFSQPQKMGDDVVGRVWSFRDVTERTRMEEKLRESQMRLSEIIEFLPDATLVIDKDGKVMAWNRAIESMTGIRAEKMLGKGDYEYALPFYGDRRPILIDLALHPNPEMEKHYTSIQRMGDILFGESFTPNLPPGNVHLSATASVLRDSRGDIIAAIECIRDNTERKRLEERLHRSEKMEALGTLAGGVAHDLNNVLGVLVGYSELLLLEIPEGNPWRRHISNILLSSQRAAAIIQDLLTLARRGVAVSEAVNLNRVITDYLETPEFEKLKAHHPSVTLKADLEKGLLNIKGSQVHLGKTIMNLVSNASEAISDEGEVIIRTMNCYIDKPIHDYDDVREGDYVVLTVSDNGRGISASDIKKIFEPFYTKKVMGRSGTGLGLAVVWGTVKDHNGYIDVQSEDGKGSTFTIYLPATREELTGDEQKTSPDDYMGSGESILVVDDVKEQREVAGSMLTRLGYRVEAVSSGEEAIAYLKASKADLIVLDMIMDPGMDGLETYRRVLAINPKQKAIIVSGFSETERVKKALELGAGAYVRKPYLLEKIGTAIRKELLLHT